ncbi:MAG: hypothetical protein WB500_11470 [Rhodoplanes sp.]
MLQRNAASTAAPTFARSRSLREQPHPNEVINLVTANPDGDAPSFEAQIFPMPPIAGALAARGLGRGITHSTDAALRGDACEDQSSPPGLAAWAECTISETSLMAARSPRAHLFATSEARA